MLSYRRISRHQHCHQLQGAILDPISRHFSDITSESPMFTPPKPKYRGSVQVFSGIQPTGVIHIGNYLGAVANFAIMQDLELIRARQFAAGQLAEGSSNHSTNGGTKSKKPIPPKKPLYCIVDMHSITIHQVLYLLSALHLNILHPRVGASLIMRCLLVHISFIILCSGP